MVGDALPHHWCLVGAPHQPQRETKLNSRANLTVPLQLRGSLGVQARRPAPSRCAGDTPRSGTKADLPRTWEVFRRETSWHPPCPTTVDARRDGGRTVALVKCLKGLVESRPIW